MCENFFNQPSITFLDIYCVRRCPSSRSLSFCLETIAHTCLRTYTMLHCIPPPLQPCIRRRSTVPLVSASIVVECIHMWLHLPYYRCPFRQESDVEVNYFSFCNSWIKHGKIALYLGSHCFIMLHGQCALKFGLCHKL